MQKHIQPRQLHLYSDLIAGVYEAVEQNILEGIVKRVKTSKDVTSDTVLQWQFEKLKELNMYNREMLEEIAKASDIAINELEELTKRLGFETWQELDELTKRKQGKQFLLSDLERNLNVYAEQGTYTEAANLIRETLMSYNGIERTYRDIVQTVAGEVLTGTKTVNKALAETIRKWHEKGVPSGFVDRGGKRWRLSSYARTVIRSTVNNTYNEIRMQGMEAAGLDLVIIPTLPSARKACAACQGKVLTTKRQGYDGYHSIYEYDYGLASGLRGINCRHMFVPYVEGVNVNNQVQIDEKQAYELYKKEQKQRALERQVLRAKERLSLVEGLDDDEAKRASMLVRKRQAALRQYIADNDGLKRNYEREKLYR